MFKALVVEKDAESGKTSAAVREIGLEDLPEGEVTVAVEYSTLNYKDGLCIGSGVGWCGLTRTYRGSTSPVRSSARRTRATSPATRWF